MKSIVLKGMMLFLMECRTGMFVEPLFVICYNTSEKEEHYASNS